jgi:hypothetical protein
MDSCLMLGFPLAHEPIIGIDIWEHVRKTITGSRRIVFLTSAIPTGLLPTVQERQAGCETPCPPYAFHPVADLALQYLNAIWNVINFKEAEKRYIEAKH